MQKLDPTAFLRLSEQEALVVGEFVRILEEEQQALTEGQIDRIVTLADTKNGYCQQLDRFARQRLMLISAAGLAAGPSLKAWLAKQDDHLKETWSALLSLAERAQDLNRQNGQLIAGRMQTNSQALNVLLAAADRASLYGPDGQPRTRAGGRILGKG